MKLKQIEVYRDNELVANVPLTIMSNGQLLYSMSTVSVSREVQLEIAKQMRRGWTSGMVKNYRWKNKG